MDKILEKEIDEKIKKESELKDIKVNPNGTFNLNDQEVISWIQQKNLMNYQTKLQNKQKIIQMKT